jgi:hypothetical protein
VYDYETIHCKGRSEILSSKGVWLARLDRLAALKVGSVSKYPDAWLGEQLDE